MVEQLIEAHLVFLEQEFAQAETVQVELKQFYHWLCLQPLQHIWSFDVIYQLIEKQIFKQRLKMSFQSTPLIQLHNTSPVKQNIAND